MIVFKSEKKSSFLSGPASKAFSPPPLGLVAIGTFFLTIKKNLFSLVAHPFSPPPFFAASLLAIQEFTDLCPKKSYDQNCRAKFSLVRPPPVPALMKQKLSDLHNSRIFSFIKKYLVCVPCLSIYLSACG